MTEPTDGRDPIETLGERIFTVMDWLEPDGETWNELRPQDRELYISTAGLLLDRPEFFLKALAHHEALEAAGEKKGQP